jgi:hypothetical protein
LRATTSKPITPVYRGPGACGSMSRRTVERTPSAPISMSAVAVLPSAKWAVMAVGVSTASTSSLP